MNQEKSNSNTCNVREDFGSHPAKVQTGDKNWLEKCTRLYLFRRTLVTRLVFLLRQVFGSRAATCTWVILCSPSFQKKWLHFSKSLVIWTSDIHVILLSKNLKDNLSPCKVKSVVSNSLKIAFPISSGILYLRVKQIFSCNRKF